MKRYLIVRLNSRFVITWGVGSLGVVTSIIISNSNSPSLLSGVSLMPGDIDEARRFARFIQLYMEKEELPDIPEFEKYRNEVNV